MSLYTPDPNKVYVEMPLGITLVERKYSMIADADDATFKKATAYFRTRKDRFVAVRKADPGEFDSLDSSLYVDGAFVRPPQAWVRECRQPHFGFRVVMVWRGSLDNVQCDEQGYLRLESDEAVEIILNSFLIQGACNWPEMTLYQQKLARAKDIYNASHSAAYGSGKVN